MIRVQPMRGAESIASGDTGVSHEKPFCHEPSAISTSARNEKAEIASRFETQFRRFPVIYATFIQLTAEC
jgi:hypothetical protein